MSPIACEYDGDCSLLDAPVYDLDLVFERKSGGSDDPLEDTRCP